MIKKAPFLQFSIIKKCCAPLFELSNIFLIFARLQEKNDKA